MLSPLLYLDPGTGSLLLYALVGIGATLIFSLKGVWYKIQTLFSPTARVSHELPDLVFHSEGGKYWQVFQPVIKALNELNIPCAYITHDKHDPAFKAGFSLMTVINPGNEMTTISYMNHIKAKLVVSTTPHLDIYMLKRSKHVGHYAHLFHSPTDVSFYEKYAFDYYDSLLTVGPFQEAHIRFLENKRGTRVKELFPVGNCYFDYQKEQLEEMRSHSTSKTPDNIPTILYAPTWGVRSSLVKYGSALILNMVNEGFRVLFRPHPQSWVSHKDIMDQLKDDLNENPLVEWDTNKTGMESMERSHAMVTDVSGVLFDYAFLFSKPILLMNSEVSKKGFEAEDLPEEWDVASCRTLSRVVEADEVDSLSEILKKVLAHSKDYGESVEKFRDKEIYNFGNAGKAAAKVLQEIKEKLAL